MIKIPPLKLPDKLPHPEAIKSCKDNIHSYETEFWEAQYEIYRYLQNVTNRELIERYHSILRNMRALISDQRHIIPVQSFFSSWYWYRKEHQTRCELYLRDLDKKISPPFGKNFELKKDAPARPRSPNAGDVLFRFSNSEYIIPMIEEGIVRISPASKYKDNNLCFARNDEELIKSAFLPGQYSRITHQSGRELKVIGDIKSSVSAPNYYAICMSCEFDDELFNDFESDACLIIHNPKIFAQRIESQAMSDLAGWYFLDCPVEYFDPYEKPRKQFFDAAMCKDFCFAYQREYRFIWVPMKSEQTTGYKEYRLGSLKDIATLYTKN